MDPEPVTAQQAARRLHRQPVTIRQWGRRYQARTLGTIDRCNYYDYADLATIDACLHRGQPVPPTAEERDRLRASYRSAA